MREILFKAKQKDWRDLPEESWWVEGYYAMMGKEDMVRHYIVQNCALTSLFSDPEENMYFNDVEIDPETVCQYTGLKDKNGKRIWENDIVSGYFNHKKITGFIKYGSNAVYYIEREGSYGIHLDNSEDWLEVIGNIFDNPELLKGE